MSFASQAGQSTFFATILPIALDAAMKSALVLIAAGVAVGCMRKCSAAARHLVWFLAVASLPLLPVLSLALPGWHILPRWFNVSKPPTLEQPAAPIVEVASSSPAPIEPVVPVEETAATPGLQRPPDSSVEKTAFKSPVPPTMASAPAPHDRIDPLRLALPVWLTGAALAFLPTALGLFSLWRLERGSRRETASSWLELLRQLVDRLNFRRAVALLKTNRRRMPMTWGIFRPKLLLPEESQDWPTERRRVVLLHELAHAKRWDYLTNLVTQFVCALYWFNPLVWFAAQQMIAERERACDDIVLRHGARPADYAEQILQIAAGLRLERWAGCGGIAMARPSKLEGRLRAILEENRNRAAVTRWVVLGALVLLAAVVLPVAMMKASSAESSKSETRTPNTNPILVTSVATNVPPLERKVSLNVHQMPLKDALAAVCREAKVELELDREAFEFEGLTIEKPVTIMLVDEPLESAVATILDRLPWDHFIFQSMRGEKLLVSGHRIVQERTRRALPEWLRPLYNNGLVAELDGDRNVVSIYAGGKADDEFLAKLKTLPRLRVLDIEATHAITPAGLAHLAELSALEKLHLYNVNDDGAGLGDDALRAVSGIRTLRDLDVGQCSVTDDGVRALEGMTQLTSLSLSENRLTDAAIKSMAGLTNLQRLNLSGNRSIHSRMRITDAGLKQLSRLTELRELFVGNLPVSDNALSLPHLRSLGRYDDGSVSEAALKNPFVAPEILDTPGWGEAVEGFQVRLRAPQTTVRAGRIPRLLVDVANRGSRELRCTTNSWCWQLEVDGIPYVADGGRYPGPGSSSEGGGMLYSESGGALLDVLPGRPWANLPLILNVAWRTADTHDLGGRFSGGGSPQSAGFRREPLRLTPGRHTLRLTVLGEPKFSGHGLVFAVSNPVEIEIEGPKDADRGTREEQSEGRQKDEGKKQNGAPDYGRATPSIEISLGLRSVTGIEFRGSREFKYPLAFRVKNVGQTALSGRDIPQLLFDAVLHARSADGVDRTNAFRQFWMGLVPQDLAPGEMYEDRINGDLLTYVSSVSNGVYEIWWTMRDLKSNSLRFEVAKGQVTLVTDPMVGSAAVPPQLIEPPPQPKGTGAVSVRERIEQLIRAAPSTTNLDLEIWEPGARNAFAVRSNVVQLGYYNESGLDSNSVFGMVYHLPVQNRFYIGWGEFRNGPNRYYGPFAGNPFDILGGPNGSGWKKTAHSPDPKRIEPDNPFGLDDETIVRLFRLGKKLQQIAWGVALPPRNSNIAFHSVEELYANNINRDELTSDPFGSGPLRFEWREGKVRLYSVGPDGEWNRGELIEPGDPELKGDLGVEIEIGRSDIHWLAGGAVLDYLQGKHTARYLAKKGTHYAVMFPLPQWAGEKLQFGPMVDGLRAAVELITTNGEFVVGRPIEVRFHIRNEADHDIQIASEGWRQGDQALVDDEEGTNRQTGQIFYSGISPVVREILKPGQTATIKSASLELFRRGLELYPGADATNSLNAKHPVGYTAKVKPGKCTIRFRLRFPGWTAQLMDWRGELETGPVVLELKPLSEASTVPAMSRRWRT